MQSGWTENEQAMTKKHQEFEAGLDEKLPTPSPWASSSVEQQLVLHADMLVKEYRKAMRQMLNQRVDDRRAIVISMLRLLEPCTVQELSERLEKHKAAVSALLLRMEEDGLVSSKANQSDRRSKQVMLTAKGKKLEKTINATGSVVETIGMDSISADDLQQANETLLRIIRNIGKLSPS